MQQPDGVFAAAVQLTAPSEVPIGSAQVAATTATAVVLWPTGPFERQRIRYVVRPAGAGVSTARTLTTDGGRGFALAAAGDLAIVGWVSGHTVRVATLQG